MLCSPKCQTQRDFGMSLSFIQHLFSLRTVPHVLYVVSVSLALGTSVVSELLTQSDTHLHILLHAHTLLLYSLS